MTGSTLQGAAPSTDVPLSDHPVHRATSLLQRALLGATDSMPDDKGRKALVCRLTAATAHHATRPNAAIVVEPDEAAPPVRFVDQALEDALARIQAPVKGPTALGASQSTYRSGARDTGNGAVQGLAVHSQLRGLIRTFRDRQRQAGLVVGCSVATAVVLTVFGMVLLFAATTPGTAGPDNAASAGGAKERLEIVAKPRPGA